MSSTRMQYFALFCLALTIVCLTIVMKKWHFGLREDFGDPVLNTDFSLLRRALLQQIRERQQEIAPLYNFTDRSSEIQSDFSDALRSDIGCSDLSGLRVVEFLGAGYTKTVSKVVLQQGSEVALKTVNYQGTDMRSCLDDFRDPQGCQDLVSSKIRKEIILLQRLKHPNIVKLKGQCQDSALVGGIIAVLEQGTPVQMIQLLQSPWEERFRVCLGLVRLLHYLSLSPLGSVALLDFQPRQFVMVSGELKLTDLDDAIVAETECRTSSDCVLQFPLRNFTFPCTGSGVCQGLNEMKNLYNAYRYFFIYLLPHQAPTELKHLVDQIMNTTADLKHSVNKTLEAFEEVLEVYKSGLHLQNLPSSLIKDYAVLKGMGTSGNKEYNCWPSYNHEGCMLSVHSAEEAAHICNSHPQCTSFCLNGQKTWTGRLLASFRTGFSHLVPDVSSTVYVRTAKASAATF
ncbi:extracellular tyrosine-protein kinase PKDCC [Silurus asotus]|uniref:Extracellular tyrosine-protein kinase PKDCC n=1 Tax=Silurus asotus TaxID=30991 RepID=A0AAD5AIL6_SILAS|nr:extracellular tyrosine-protein kinase PKDCC [Silurus asotus]